MKVSQLFTKTRKEVPADEPSKNAQLLIRAGFIHKEMAGVYSFLPLGLRVLNKISNVIREEMDDIGGQEISLTALQSKELWEKSGRWDDRVVDDWFKTKLKNSTELGLGLTHEEPLSVIMRSFVSSYKDLPVYPYQIQTKFRNELRSKSGLLRGREFLMKDMYSFSLSQKEHDEFYEKVKGAYRKIYERLGIGKHTYLTFASGGSFAQYSHEFQTLTDAGEDTIYLDEKRGIAVNDEVYTDQVLDDLGLNKADLKKVRGIEVGNIFNLGTKFSEPFNLKVKDQKGNEVTVIMGSYGIGVSRAMGTVAEVLSDEKGIIWPEEIAPFKVYIAPITESKAVIKATDELYQKLLDLGIEVLYDDRIERAGIKFADADLLGIPYRVVISEELAKKKHFELKNRSSNIVNDIKWEKLIEILKK